MPCGTRSLDSARLQGKTESLFRAVHAGENVGKSLHPWGPQSSHLSNGRTVPLAEREFTNTQRSALVGDLSSPNTSGSNLGSHLHHSVPRPSCQPLALGSLEAPTPHLQPILEPEGPGTVQVSWCHSSALTRPTVPHLHPPVPSCPDPADLAQVEQPQPLPAPTLPPLPSLLWVPRTGKVFSPLSPAHARTLFLPALPQLAPPGPSALSQNLHASEAFLATPSPSPEPQLHLSPSSQGSL